MQPTTLDDFAEEIQPIVARVLRRRFRGASLSPRDDRRENERARDCYQQALLLLCKRFDRWLDGSAPAIEHIPSYAARVANNVANEEIRPMNWTRLSNRIRRVVSTDPQFDTWEHDEWGPVVGYAGWRGQRTTLGSVPALREVVEELGADAVTGKQWERLATSDTAVLLAAVLDAADGPLQMGRLVHFLAQLLGIVVEVPPDDGEDGSPSIEPVSPDAPEDDSSIVRTQLQDLWGCAQLLRRERRVALLMNLPSAAESNAKAKKRKEKNKGTKPRSSGRGTGRGDLAVFPANGIASIAEIGDVLGLTPGEYQAIWAALSRTPADATDSAPFHALWTHLPLKDKVIGRALARTGQQIADLRKKAIEELAGCMKGHGHFL